MSIISLFIKLSVVAPLRNIRDKIAYITKVDRELDREYKDLGKRYAGEFLDFIAQSMPYCTERLRLSSVQQQVIYFLLDSVKKDEVGVDLSGYRSKGSNLLRLIYWDRTRTKPNPDNLDESLDKICSDIDDQLYSSFGLNIYFDNWSKHSGAIYGRNGRSERTEVVALQILPTIPSSIDELAELFKLSSKDKNRRAIRVYDNGGRFYLESYKRNEKTVDYSSNYLLLGSFFSEALNRESYVYGLNTRNTHTNIPTPERVGDFADKLVPVHQFNS